MQGPFRTKRSLFTTFLDDDILIVRDETGVPDIWLRKVVIPPPKKTLILMLIFPQRRTRVKLQGLYIYTYINILQYNIYR